MNTSDRKVQRMWLDPAFLSWENHYMSWKPLDRKKAKRPYEIHEHASNRLAQGTNLDRVDAITTLKRAVTHRVQVLKAAYGLDALEIPGKPKRDLELLAYLGIVRPLMLKRLIDIRNIVEHEDSDPPAGDDCEIFADFVWYFLRSTDVLAHRKLSRFSVVPQESKHRIASEPEIRINYYDSHGLYGPSNGSVLTVNAYLQQASIAYGSKPGWIEVKGVTETRDDLTFIEGEFTAGSQAKLIWAWYFSRPFEGPWEESF